MSSPRARFKCAHTFNHTISTDLIEFEEFVHLISSFVLKNNAHRHICISFPKITPTKAKRWRKKIKYIIYRLSKSGEAKEPKITDTHMNSILYRDFKRIRKTTSRWYFSQKERFKIQVRFNVHFKCKEIYGNRAGRRRRSRKTKINNIRSVRASERAQTHTQQNERK